MSDTSQGAGWWEASDHKWYPPHLHPDAVAAREAAGARPPTAQQPSVQQAQHWPSAVQPSQPSQAPAWGQTAAEAQAQAQAPAGRRIPSGTSVSGDAYSYGGKPARRAPDRRVVVALVAVVGLAVVGVGAYFLFKPNGGTIGAGGALTAPNAKLGQSETVTVLGTTLTMTVTRVLDPAPVPDAQASQTPVAFLVTLSNSGSVAYNLRDLAFGVSQGDTSSGGTGFTTSAGPPFRQSGRLAAGDTESGWVTSVADPEAGPVTSLNVTFNAQVAAGPTTTVFREWNTS